MSWSLDGIPLRSVLVTRLRYLGDVVMSTVVLEALKLGDPALRLGYLAEENHGQILRGHPLLDRLHLLRVKRQGSDARARPTVQQDRDQVRDEAGRGVLGTLAGLNAEGYDLAVDLFFNPRSAWLLRLAGIPRRIGGTRGSRGWLYTHTVLRRETAARHPGFNALAPGGLGEHLCRLEPLRHEPTGLGFADWLQQTGGGQVLAPRLVASGRAGGPGGPEAHRPYLVLAPGATWATKEWPTDHWLRLVESLLAGREEDIFILQPPGQPDWAMILARSIPAGRGRLLPVMPLDRVQEWLARARLLVTVDGGIMHTAVALGVPTLALFGPTRTDAWFPYEGLGPYRVLATRPPCSPCDLHQCPDFVCMPDLDPALVADRALDLLKAGGDSGNAGPLPGVEGRSVHPELTLDPEEEA